MGPLTSAIDEYIEKKTKQLPPSTRQLMEVATAQLRATGIEDHALGVGDLMPDFELPNQHGEKKRLYDYLADSTLVLNIYRGGWCPYCNLEMKALHDVLPQIEAQGARLVGMAPETPDHALETAANNDIKIDILSDEGNRVSERLGLVFELPEPLRPVYAEWGIDIPAFNGDESFRLPVPATYIVAQDGHVAHAFVNADYRRRMEPEDIVSKLANLAEVA